ATEGSSLHELRVANLRVSRRIRKGVVVEIGAGGASALGPALRRELIADGARFSVIGDTAEATFYVEPEPSWSVTDDGVEVRVPLELVERLASLFDGRTGSGWLEALQALSFRVVK